MNWGTQATHKLPPATVVPLMKDNGIQKVKLFDADDSTMDALAGSGIEVMVTIPNKQLVVGVLRPQVHSKEHGNFVVIKMTNPKVLC